jgi:hypothetical protein
VDVRESGPWLRGCHLPEEFEPGFRPPLLCLFQLQDAEFEFSQPFFGVVIFVLHGGGVGG